MLKTTVTQVALLDGSPASAGDALRIVAARANHLKALVRGAESQGMHHLETLCRLTGLTEDQLLPALAPTLTQREVPRFQARTLAQAPQEILRTMGAADKLGRLVNSRQAEFEATLQRQALGQASELELAERYYLLLFDTDRLVALNGEMALAWIHVQRATGDALQALSQSDLRPRDGAPPR
jgi:hypothetical protein